MDQAPIFSNNELAISSPQELAELAFDFASNALSSNTKRTYSCGWKSFSLWCSLLGVNYLTADNKEGLISFYIADMASKGTLKVSSIACYLSAIQDCYRERGVVVNIQHPAIKKVLKGIRKTLHKRPVQKDPLLTDEIKEMVQTISTEKDGKPYLAGVRDRALLLLGFSGAFRRSELVSLNFEDLKLSRDGFLVLLKSSKTDQEGEGLEKAIPYGGNPITCPVRAIQDWIQAAQIKNGPLFSPINRHGQILARRLTGHAVALIIKRSCQIGKSESFSGHSLRAGFVTSAAKKKVPEHLIMKQTGHKCSDTLKRYIRIGTCFDENAASLIGL
jgi:integrase